jgi:DNA-binding transcriptional LysR family regulator
MAEGIDRELLAETPLVLFSRGTSPDYYERVMSACGLLGWQPRVRHEVRHWLSVVAWVRKGMGGALVPAALVDSGMGDVVFETLPQLPMMSDVYLVWRRKSVPEALLDSFQV